MINIILTSIILAMPLYLFRFTVLGIPTNVFEVVLYLSLLVWMWYRYRTNSKKVNFSTGSNDIQVNWRLPWVVWAWLGIGLIGALVNPDWLSGLGFWRAYFIDGALVYLIIGNEIDVAKVILPRALIAIGGIVSVVSLISATGWHVAIDGRWLGWFGFDNFASPNYLSLFIAPIVALSIMAMFFWRGLWRYLALVSSLIMIIALVGSQSRGAVVGVVGGIIVAIVYYAYRNKQKYTWLKWSALALIIIATATFYIAKPNANASPADGRVATSNNIRWEIWKTSTEIIKGKPIFGVGLGNFQEYFTQLTIGRVNYPEFISPLALTAHNLYLQVLTTLGTVGLIIFIWWLIIIIKAMSASPNKAETTIVVSTLASILLYGLVDTPFFKNDLAILWWVIVSLIMVYGKEKSQA